VLFVGLGSVGATAALSLAQLHVGELRLVDRSRFTPASLLTQPIAPRRSVNPRRARSPVVANSFHPVAIAGL